MTESMIERVGAAVDGELKRLGLLQNISVGNVIARAAIEAMRAPTEAMKDAGAFHDISFSYGGDEHSFNFVSEDDAGEIFRTMIDAALQWPPRSADRAGVPLAKD